MMNEDSVRKLLGLCEQKYGPNAPAMRELREQLDAIHKLAAKRDAIRTARAFGGGAAG